jgi:zinc transport system ATP-binding protein
MNGGAIPPAVEVNAVSFGYGGDVVIDELSCALRAGELVAVAGANGVGKSTLLHLVLGLYQPQSGTVRLFGEPPTQLSRRSALGYVPQRRVIADVLPATVGEVLLTGLLSRGSWWKRPSAADRERALAALDAVDLAARVGDRFQTLSGGQQQRVLIAKALAGDPRLLVLDEPLAGVDATSQELIAAVLRARADAGAAVIVVSHELEVLDPVVDRVLLLAKGKIAFDGQLADLPVHRHGHGHW